MTAKPQQKQLSIVQKELLKIYQVVKQLCEKNHIRFYAIGGTALGAVRHKGFIPWDDDIDLGIPIDDYEKFINVCQKELPTPYQFTPLHLIGGKIHNTQTTFIEAQCVFSYPDQYTGIFIDIFPLIGAPNNKTERNNFLKEMHDYFNQAFIFDRYPECSNLTKTKINNWRRSLLHRYSQTDSKYTVEFATGFEFLKTTSGLNNPIIMQFENTTVPVTSTFETDLQDEYGNWRQLPPVNQRHTHDKYALIDHKKPYSYYYTKISQIDPQILKLLQLKDEQEGLFFNDLQQLNLQHTNLIKLYEKQNQELSKLRYDLNQIINSRSYKITRKLQKLSSRFKLK